MGSVYDNRVHGIMGIHTAFIQKRYCAFTWVPACRSYACSRQWQAHSPLPGKGKSFTLLLLTSYHTGVCKPSVKQSLTYLRELLSR